MPSPSHLAAALFVALSLTATACGGGDSPSETADPPANSDTTATGVHDVEVLEVGTGESTTIADTVTGDRPVLLWFWAPH